MDKSKAINIIKAVLYYMMPIMIFIFLCTKIFNESIWLDEAFSLSMIQQGFGDIIKNTASDVHPPLYYIILKTFSTILKSFFNNNIIYASKLISLIPIALLLIINYTMIEKLFNKKTAFLFAIFILGMPQIMKYAIEIRMYSWGMLFVTMIYIYAIKWVKENKFSQLCMMVIFTILSAYTHYFALVSAGCIYLILLIYLIVKKDSDKFKKCIISGFTIFLAYLPWLIILIKQVLVVKENYWIENMTLNTIKAFFKYPYTIKGNDILTFIIATLIMIAIIVSIVKRKQKSSIYAICGFLIPIGTIAIGIIASKLIRPVFIERYMVCSLGCLWLAVASIFGNYANKKYIFMVISIIAIMICMNNAKVLINQEKIYKKETINSISYINNVNEEYDILIFDNNQLQRVVSYYYPSIENYVYKKEISELTKQVYKQTKMKQISKINNLEDIEKNIYIFANDTSILEDIKSNGYKYEECGKYQIEIYKFSIYKIIK